MRRVLVTGARGFIGRHVAAALRRAPGVELLTAGRDTAPETLAALAQAADAIVHLAGVNRPADPSEFDVGNRSLTERLCESAGAGGRRPLVVLASSIQAAVDSPYGVSKRRAEEALAAWAARTGAEAVAFRLTNVFGKWARPNYNSVVATFCDAIANGRPYTVSDPLREVPLTYVDDVVTALVGALDSPGTWGALEFREAGPVRRVTLGELEARLLAFRDTRTRLTLPDFSDAFTRQLYATYLSYLPGDEFAYGLDRRVDARGALAEFVKGASFGQIFVSRTFPGVTRGNHFHHTKTEKFLVVEGEGSVRFRHVDDGDAVIEHRVSGRDFRVVDIPPGYTHSIENVGDGEMVVVFWASEVFDPGRPDTYAEDVLRV